MASASPGSSHLGVSENQKRWLVAGIALNKILIPQIRPFVEQGINAEYNNLKTSHNIDTQSSSGRLQRWPQVLKYENINGNDGHPKLPGGRFNFSLFDCKVTSHVDFARLYVQNHMAHFTAFDDHCDASAVLALLGRVPVFSAAVQTAADQVREARNDWAHCVFSKWDQAKFQKSFTEMEQLVRDMALPTADEGKLVGELKDWETKGTHLCMNSPVDPALLQLVQQEVQSLQDDVKNMSVECDKEKTKVHTELQNCANGLEELQQRIERLEHRTGQTEKKVDELVKMSKSEGAQTLLVKPKLPAEDKDFMGRQRECEQILHHLSSDSTRIVSIFGPPGFGKSQVAIAVGNDLKFQGQTVYHLELRRVLNKDKLISQIRCNFNVPPNCRDLSGEELLFNLFNQVDGHLYFILDNADKLLEPNVKDDVINLIKEILEKFSNVTFIVTTRESPAFMQLESLGQKLIRVGPLGKFYCQNLVQKLLPDSSDDDRKEIVQLCGNMPFAIILMCRSIAQNEKPLNKAIKDFKTSTNRIIKELDKYNPEEVSDKRLNGIFGSSFESLPSQEDKEAFVSLSVISGNFDEEVASGVLGESKAKETLTRLYRRSLINSSSGSYQMHKLLQSFGREKGEKEMNEVLSCAKTRFHEYYIRKFSKLNKKFLSGKSNSMSAFISFYQDKDRFVSSLIEGCSEGGKTSDKAFDVLMNAELFLDTVLWSDGTTFDEIYDSALKEAEKRGNKTVYNQLVVAKALSEVTWGTAEIKAMQSLSFMEEIEDCPSDREKLIKGKRSCYFGIYQLVSGKLKEGVKLLENALSYFYGTMTSQFLILKVLACQILSLYYETENMSERAKDFYKNASEECDQIGDPSLLVIPQLNEYSPKEEKFIRGHPLALEMYFVISKAIKIFSEKTVKSLEQDVLRMEKEIYRKSPTNSVKRVGIFHFHRTVVGVLGEMKKYKEAIQSIKATIDFQKTALMQFTNSSQVNSTDANTDAVTEDPMLHEHKEALAKSYFNLAVLQFRVKDYEASLHSQRFALEVRRELFGEGHANTADSYHELAIILRTLEDCNSALFFQQRALDIRLDPDSNQNPSKKADSYHELGVTQCKMGDYSAALRSHTNALEIRLEHLGNRHKDTASSYHELGVTQWYLEVYECALDSHKEALRIALEVFGEHHSATADSYHELGKTQFCLEDYLEALESHSKALHTRLDVLGEEHYDTANSLYEMAVTEFETERYTSALQYHKRSLTTRQKIHENRKSMESEISQSYHQLGRIQCQMGDYSQAFYSINCALSVRGHLLGEQHAETAESYYELGKTFFYKKDYVSSLVMHQFALSVRKKTLGEEAAKTADSLCQLGLVQCKLGYKQSSLESHKCAQEIRQKRFGTMHSKTAESYYQVGLIQHELGCYNVAIDSLLQGLKTQQEIFGYYHTATADSYVELGNTQLKRKNFDYAFKCFQDALHIRTDLLAKQQSALAYYSHDQQVEESLLQDYTSALQLYQRASTVTRKYSSILGSHDHLLRGGLGELKERLGKKASTYYELGKKELTLKITETPSSTRELTPALHLHQRALEMRRELFGESHLQSAVSYRLTGLTLYLMNDFPSALQSLQRALEIRRKQFGEYHPETAESYLELGATQCEMNDFAAALQSHQRALHMRLKLFGKNHPKTAECYQRFGDTQQEMNDFAAALQSHQRALDIRLKLFGENHPKTADSYQSFGVTQQEMNDFAAALQSHQRALDIRLKLFGENHSKTADSYQELGVTQRGMNDFAAALRSHQRALDISLKLFGENHSETADSYNSLGVTQLEMNDFAAALQSQQRALDIRLNLFGENHPQTADSYHGLGATQQQMNKFAAALQLQQRSLEIRLKLFGENHSKTADSYHILGITQRGMNDFAAALKSHQRALDLRLKLFGENNSKTANTYHNLGITQRRMNDFAAALQSHQRALDIRLKLLGENHSETADSYHELGLTQWKMEDFAAALQSHQRALDIRLKLFGENHLKTADSYHSLGVTQWKMEDFAAALQSHQCALDIRLKLFGENHSETAESYHLLGVTQHEMKLFTSALQSKQRALDIRLIVENHPQTADSFHSLCDTEDEILRIVRKARKFEGEHKDCLRVLPHTYDGQMLVEFYVYRCEPGVPEDLKAAAQEFFGGMNLKLKWSDLYNDASNLLNIVSVDYPSGKAKRLEVSQVDEINEVINKNLALFSKHRNITAVQASFKVTKSKQTEEPCIMVYVLGKGRIPIGESEIPRTVGSYPVDIVDGFWFRTVDPWEPTEAQEQGEVLRLGASIGVRGEEACGTLGAVVKDENSGIWYLLSCDHVINRAKESKIIHPGWNSYINFLKYHLNEYRKWIGRITKQTTPTLAECLQEHDKLSEKFMELKALKEEKLKALEEEVPARSIPPTTFKNIEKHERALENGFSKLPRIVANYTTGVHCNVEWTDGKEYFVDAAIAELSYDEVESLKLSGTTEIIGTGDYPSCEYTLATTEAIVNVGELCKSGSATGYTKSDRLLGASVGAPCFMQLPEYEIKNALVSMKKYDYYCEKCAKSRTAESVTENVQGSDNFTCKKCEGCMERKASHCESRWLKNCLCIESEKNPFVDKGDSGAVIFEKRDPNQDCLPGFGIVFGEFQTAFKSYALASPLEVALKTLSKTVSTTCNLKLVSNCDE